MEANVWSEVLKQYDMLGVDDVLPIAHVRIRSDIGILLDDYGNFMAATINRKDRCSIPCTIDSESRTSGDYPHPIHDNMSYICSDYPEYQKRHQLYMSQLKRYIDAVDDILAKSVYRYLQKSTIRLDVEPLLKQITDIPEKKIMITFATIGHRSTTSEEWTKYYISTLPQNGICAITGEPDYVPEKYPKGIRSSVDQAKLFISNTNRLDSMPVLAPGYIASQKIIHTLQFMIYEGDSWAYSLLRDNPDISDEWKKWIKSYEIKMRLYTSKSKGEQNDRS